MPKWRTIIIMESISAEGDMGNIEKEMDQAAYKARDSLSRYKFAMFGYWAGIWVHLNKISGLHRPNPFIDLVKMARE